MLQQGEERLVAGRGRQAGQGVTGLLQPACLPPPAPPLAPAPAPVPPIRWWFYRTCPAQKEGALLQLALGGQAGNKELLEGRGQRMQGELLQPASAVWRQREELREPPAGRLETVELVLAKAKEAAVAAAGAEEKEEEAGQQAVQQVEQEACMT